MKKETIIYKNKKYNRYPESKRRQLRVYYWRHDKWKESPVALHRQIWIDNHGDIPKGFVIHHKDDNPLNNDISNLEMISHGDHTRLHSKKPKRQKQLKENAIKNLPKLKKACEEYKQSKEGKEFFKKNVSNSIHYKIPRKKKCLECKEIFTYKIKNEVKYCSKLCGSRYRRKLKIK